MCTVRAASDLSMQRRHDHRHTCGVRPQRKPAARGLQGHACRRVDASDRRVLPHGGPSSVRRNGVLRPVGHRHPTLRAGAKTASLRVRERVALFAFSLRRRRASPLLGARSGRAGRNCSSPEGQDLHRVPQGRPFRREDSALVRRRGRSSASRSAASGHRCGHSRGSRGAAADCCVLRVYVEFVVCWRVFFLSQSWQFYRFS